ncbi:MAG: hypothetical protein ACJ71O_18750, partial [Nitrososphaeraceae archaeon]
HICTDPARRKRSTYYFLAMLCRFFYNILEMKVETTIEGFRTNRQKMANTAQKYIGNKSYGDR